MTYELVIGERMYSTWSLRPWLIFEQFDLPVRVVVAPMATPQFAADVERIAPSLTVPAVRIGDVPLWDSLAIIETLAERHPECPIWPADPAARALARSMAAEMHASFSALRNACPMNLRALLTGVAVTDAVRADLARIEDLWAMPGGSSVDPWLFGGYSAVDAMFAPVAARIAGYGLAVSAPAEAYVRAHLSHGPFRRWRAMAFAGDRPMERYETHGYTPAPWPGPTPRPAKAVAAGTPENALCPFSGRPVTDLAEIDGRIIGFCNAFCRDKAVADPDAWPKVVALLEAA
ncbi:MAG: glutathione S-transferase [Pseudomonadota bacterium]